MEVADLLSRLIQAESPSGGELAAQRVLGAALEELGFEVRVDPAGNLETVLGEGPEILLTGHMDIVPAGDPAAWPYPPFGGVIEGGRIWGRGAVDMKGPLAAMVGALSRLRGGRLAGSVRFLAVVQEEVGGLGSRYAASRLTSHVALLGEPSRLHLMRGHRGRTEVWADFEGEQAHAALARGVNPLYAMARFLEALSSLRLPQVQITPTRVESDPPASNVVPAVARVVLDLRHEPGADLAQALDRLRALGGEASIYIPEEEMSSGSVRLRYPRHVPAYWLDDRELLGRALELLGQTEAELWAFTTDAPYLAQAGIPVLGYGPGDPALAHTVFEHLELDELERAVEGYVRLVKGLWA
jgi:succinyl-diaminopimelate desuccinylase